MSAIAADQLRQIVSRTLLTTERLDGFHNFINDVHARARHENVPFDAAVVVEYWWHLARTGVIAVTGDGGAAIQTFRYPTVMLTARGRRMLESGEHSPHHPERYLNAIRQRVAAPDPVVIAYLDEAVGAWAAGLYRSSAVMLGCACEKLILLVAGEIASKPYPPYSTTLSTKLADQRSSISGIFEDVRQALQANRNRLPGDVADRLDRKLSAIFDHARILRNQTGHPTGTPITSEDAEAGLLLFPGFYDLCDRIMQGL